jgi:hypothetical protein
VMDNGVPGIICPFELVVLPLVARMSFWVSTICKPPEKVLLTNARFVSLLVWGLLELFPLPPQAVNARKAATAGTRTRGRKMRAADEANVLVIGTL